MGFTAIHPPQRLICCYADRKRLRINREQGEFQIGSLFFLAKIFFKHPRRTRVKAKASMNWRARYSKFRNHQRKRELRLQLTWTQRRQRISLRDTIIQSTRIEKEIESIWNSPASPAWDAVVTLCRIKLMISPYARVCQRVDKIIWPRSASSQHCASSDGDLQRSDIWTKLPENPNMYFEVLDQVCMRHGMVDGIAQVQSQALRRNWKLLMKPWEFLGQMYL